MSTFIISEAYYLNELNKFARTAKQKDGQSELKSKYLLFIGLIKKLSLISYLELLQNFEYETSICNRS